MIRLFLKFSIGSWASAALSLLTLPIVTALVRPDEFGKASMFTLAVALLAQAALLGVDQAYARGFYAARDEGQGARLLREAVAVPIAISLVLAALVVAFSSFLSLQLFGETHHDAALLLAATLVLTIIERFAMLSLRLKQRALTFSMLRLVAALTQFLVIVAYAYFIAADFLSIASAQLAALGVSALIAVAIGRSDWRPGPIRWHEVRSLLAYGLPFVPAFAAMWLFEGIDKIMLRHFSTFDELGLFSAAFRFIALVSILEVSFSTFWVPVSFELFESDAEEARRKFSSSLQHIAPILFLGGCAVLLGKDLIALLFAADYRDAAYIMPFLLFIPMMYSLSQITAAGIFLQRRSLVHLPIAALSALANFLLNLWLVPRAGALGAAVSTGISYILFFALRTAISQRLFALDLRAVRLTAVIALFAAACAAHSLAPHALASYAGTLAVVATIAFLFRTELAELLAIARPSFNPAVQPPGVSDQ